MAIGTVGHIRSISGGGMLGNLFRIALLQQSGLFHGEAIANPANIDPTPRSADEIPQPVDPDSHHQPKLSRQQRRWQARKGCRESRKQK